MPPHLPEDLESFSEGWIDASRPFHSATPVWPGDHPFKLDQTREESFVLGMTWIEGLWLGDAEPGLYLTVALPILLQDAEAAPVRAILKPLSI